MTSTNKHTRARARARSHTPKTQGFVNSVLPLLHQRLSADLAAIWEEARAVRDHSNRLRTARRRSISSCGAAAPGSATAAVAAAAAARAAFGHAHPPPARTASGRSAYGRPSSDGSDGYTEDSDQITIGDAPSSQLANCATKRLCTEGMVKVRREGASARRRTHNMFIHIPYVYT